MSVDTLSIVIPAYNEAKRLPATLEEYMRARSDSSHEAFEVFKSYQNIELVVVDDGSFDDTLLVLKEYQKKISELKIIPSSPNRGKGFVVRVGLTVATQDWVLITDADLSTPWIELQKLKSETSKYQIVMGSRDVEGSFVKVHQSYLRENLGKLFNLFIRMLTRLPFKDTQCGFKLVHRNSVVPFLKSLRVDGFAWDVEFLMRARKLKIKMKEVPVEWSHKEDSRVSPLRHGLQMAWTVLKLSLYIR
jgi:dolichyl-phosphate beta-glucosyltransferase